MGIFLRSPAIKLFHEVGHAFRHTFFEKEYLNDSDTKGKQYDTVEEKKTTERYENTAAEDLGEEKRFNHDGEKIEVTDPTSTTPNIP